MNTGGLACIHSKRYGGRVLHILVNVHVDEEHEYWNGAKNSEEDDRHPVFHFLFRLLCIVHSFDLKFVVESAL